MNHVIAFDISMGKSYIVIYNAHKQYIFEQELEHSYPAVSQDDVLCNQLKVYAKRYQELLHQKQCCINKMVDMAEQRPEYRIILSIPRIGPNTAVRLMAEIGDMTRFENNKQLNAYAGIDI
ncbi:transposase, partial [Bacillus cereus]|nr:transposase [Bacillus cereus]MBG9615758.1 transposase [Bacillus cereus]